jgi:hypothetical protein
MKHIMQKAFDLMEDLIKDIKVIYDNEKILALWGQVLTNILSKRLF